MRNAGSNLAIETVGLTKGFGDWPALQSLDLGVDWGELVALFGANGSGKTTLLRILSTQARADAGRVLIAGYDCHRQANAVRRRVGLVGHSGFLYEDLTCRENLVFYGRLFRVEDLAQRVESVLERVGLQRWGDRLVKTLSHGMQKRLAIARAILHRPQVLLLDEPEGGLDADSVEMLHGLVTEWTQSGGAVVMTTHNREMGMEWADRVGFLTYGRLEMGDPEWGVEDGGWFDGLTMSGFGA